MDFGALPVLLRPSLWRPRGAASDRSGRARVEPRVRSRAPPAMTTLSLDPPGEAKAATLTV